MAIILPRKAHRRFSQNNFRKIATFSNLIGFSSQFKMEKVLKPECEE